MNTKQAWENNWKNTSNEQIMEIFSYNRVKKQLKAYEPYIKSPILEGGCGLCPYLIHYRARGFDVTGVDYNQATLDQTGLDNVYCNDVSNLGFPGENFNTYLSFGVIEHILKPQVAIDEAHRVLKVGGHLILVVPRRPLRPVRYPYYQKYFKIKELSKMLSKFAILKIVPTDHEHTLMTLCNWFRDKNTYDGANKLGSSLGDFMEKHFPFFMSASLLFVCRKDLV